MIPFGHDGGGPQFRPACRMRRSFTGLTHPNGSFVTLRWRGLDSNFQYAGAVNLVVAPFFCRRKLGRGRCALSVFGQYYALHQSDVDPTAEAAIVPATHSAKFWLGPGRKRKRCIG